MKRVLFTAEQIIGIMKKHESSVSTPEVRRKPGISLATFQIQGRLRPEIQSRALPTSG